MMQQLLERMVAVGPAPTVQAAAAIVLASDPLDVVLHMEQLWHVYNPWAPNPGPAGPARQALWATGAFNAFAPVPSAYPPWDHFGYSYVLENTRAVQILRRVVREYRSGEAFGIPSIDTQRWLDATEVLLFGAANPIGCWLSTSTARPDPEAVRRNAYWRMFGLDLAFGSDDNRPPTYDKAKAANSGFVKLFEELLFELWQAMSNVRNQIGPNQADDDRIFRIAQQLAFMLRARRQTNLLAREELAAAAALGWAELTLSADTPVVVDIGAAATSPGDRLRLIGERVGLNAHSKAASFFAMSADLSRFLRSIEAGLVSSTGLAGILYYTPSTAPTGWTAPLLGEVSRRVITEWAAATGRDLKARGKPIEAMGRQVARAQ